MLYLVRHAMPDASSGRPSRDWPLRSDTGPAVMALAGRLPEAARLFASDELRARDTLAGTGRDVATDPGFGEVRRGAEIWGDGFAVLRRRWLSGQVLPGWESQDRAFQRFDAAVDRAMVVDSGEVVVATHGMVMCNWLVGRGLLGPGEVADFWNALTFPDLLRADLAEGRLSKLDLS